MSGYEIDDRDYDEFEADHALWLGADEQHREWVVRFSDGGFEATFIGPPQDTRGLAQAELDRMRAKQHPGDDLDGRHVDLAWRPVGPWHAEHEDDPGLPGVAWLLCAAGDLRTARVFTSNEAARTAALEAFVDGWTDGRERIRESALALPLCWEYDTPEIQLLHAGRRTTEFSIRRLRFERAVD
ncbi:MAG TPA: hypothetical protein VH372_19220 [Actinospica sp.]|nr:hypothetical protein [Actinospica sp.]